MAHETSSGAKCDAKLVRISMNEKSGIHKKRADISTIEYENFFEKIYIQAVGFDCLFPATQSETLNIINKLKSESRHRIIHY